MTYLPISSLVVSTQLCRQLPARLASDDATIGTRLSSAAAVHEADCHLAVHFAAAGRGRGDGLECDTVTDSQKRLAGYAFVIFFT